MDRVWVGARISLIIGLGGAIVPQIIGIFLGGLSGFFGGWGLLAGTLVFCLVLFTTRSFSGLRYTWP